MAMAIIRVIIVMDLPSSLVSEDIISTQVMGLAVTDLAVTGSEAMVLEAMVLEGTDLEGTEGGTIGEHSIRPKKAGFPVPHCMRPAAAAAGETRSAESRDLWSGGPAQQDCVISTPERSPAC
jgi:hypothetical protein